MSVLAIIPTLNPDARLFATIECIQKSADILIIDSGSHNKEALKKISDIFEEEHHFNHASTRNRALKYPYDFYLFLTQDALIEEDDFIAQAIAPLNKEVVLSYVRQKPYKSADAIERYNRGQNYPSNSMLKSQESIAQLGIKSFFNSDSCALYEGEYFRTQKGFKANLNTNEDMEFAYRTLMDDKKIFYNASIWVTHSHNLSARELFRRYRAIGAFFKANRHILEGIAISNSGVKHALAELKHIAKDAPHLLIKSALFSLIKYIAFKIGEA